MIEVKQLCEVNDRELMLINQIKEVGTEIAKDYTLFVMYSSEEGNQGVLCRKGKQIYPMNCLDSILWHVQNVQRRTVTDEKVKGEL